MKNPIYNWLTKKYPQNQMLKNPYVGALIILLFFFLFLYIYKPLNTHESRIANYTITMAIYSIISAIQVLLSIKILKVIKYFSNNEEWTILKELISIILILLGIGTIIYFAAFFIEQPAQRWNLPTFFDSCKNAFLTGSIPFLFFTILNYRFLSFYNTSENKPSDNEKNTELELPEKIIQIDSKLKKEKLNFYPSQLLYASSEGNYVEFYLNRDNHIQKEIIRNSISNIDKQLLEIPFFFRTHRAYIVNVKKVHLKKGNTLGYRLKLSDIDVEIPVSRQYIKDFIQRFKEFN
jgi:hypothetical protein